MTSPLHPVIAAVTDRIRDRSRDSRATYLDDMAQAAGQGAPRHKLGCANLAHAFAGCDADDKAALRGEAAPSIGIVTAYRSEAPTSELQSLMRITYAVLCLKKKILI